MTLLNGIRGWSLQQKIGASFSLVLIILLLVIFQVFRTMTEYLALTDSISSTHEALEGIHKVSSDLNETIANQRSYLITGDPVTNTSFKATALGLKQSVARLGELVRDNPKQQARVKQLVPLVNRRVHILEAAIRQKMSGAMVDPAAWIRQSKGNELTIQINVLLHEMQAEEQKLLGVRSDQASAKAANMILSFTLGVGFIGLILSSIYMVTNREIAERIRVEKVLRESERRYALAALGTNDGLWDWNLETGEIYFSARWKMILGYLDHEIGNSADEWFELVHPDDLPGLRDHIAQHLEGYAASLEYEYRMCHKDGDVRWVVTRGVSAYDDFGKPNRIAGSLSDITDRKLDEERLLYEATHDALTGLYNRQYFMQQLEVEINSAKRYHYPLSLSMGDLDKFKEINDVYGHLTGDNVLISFASLVKKQIRQQDMVGRFGGDEFCFYFPHTGAKDVEVLLERIRTEFQKMVFVAENGEQFSLTCTFGVAELDPSHREGKDLIEFADRALYQAKETRNKVVVLQNEPPPVKQDSTTA